MSEAPRLDRKSFDLLERLGRTSGFGEACETLLECVLEEAGSRGGILLVRAGGAARGGGWRSGAAAVADAERAADSGTSSLGALFTLEAAHELPASDLYEVGSFTPTAVFPLASGTASARGFILADGLAGEEEIAFVEGVLRRCSAVPLRILELELARESRERSAGELVHREGILDAISDPLLVSDAAAKVVLANPRAKELFSIDPLATEQWNRAVRFNAFLLNVFFNSINSPGGAEEGQELNLVSPLDGSDLLFEIRTDRLQVEGGGEDFRISVLRDVTDLKKATMELEMEYRRSRVTEHRARQESRRLSAIIENVAEPILVTDARSDIVLMNREAERLFQPPESGEGDRYVWTNVTHLTSFVSEFLMTPSRRRIVQLTLMDPVRGRECPFEASGTRIEDDHGEATAIVTVLRDLTPLVENERLAVELRKLNDELEDRIDAATGELEERNRLLEWQSRELEKASRLKSQFLASMSHELRTPINAMLGYTSLMQEEVYGPLTDQQEGVLGKVEAASEHLLELINDVLDLSKIEAGKMPLRVEEVELPRLFAEIAQTVDPQLRKKPVELRVEIGEPVPTLRGDGTKLKQVLLNLLENAVKFTPEGEVTLRASRIRDGTWVCLQVEDTGIGIPPGDLGHIFEDFRQVDQGHARQYGGTGLGLSISRKLISLMGGRIAVESTVGEGTRFQLELPVQLEPEWIASELAAFPMDAVPASGSTSPLSGSERPDARGGRSRGASGVVPQPPGGSAGLGPSPGDRADRIAAAARPADLASTVAHALKDPLQGIVGNLELLEMGRFGELGQELRSVVDRIGRHARRMTGRVDSVIGLVTMEAERAGGIPPEGAGAAGPARMAARLLADEAEARGILVEVAVDDDLPPLSCTPDRLQHLFLALLRLALIASDAGLLRLRADPVDDGVRFAVEREEESEESGAEVEGPSGNGSGREEGRLERMVARILVEEAGGRLEWKSPGSSRHAGPALWLPVTDPPA